jgi:hypothetical protein
MRPAAGLFGKNQHLCQAAEARSSVDRNVLETVAGSDERYYDRSAD